MYHFFDAQKDSIVWVSSGAQKAELDHDSRRRRAQSEVLMLMLLFVSGDKRRWKQVTFKFPSLNLCDETTLPMYELGGEMGRERVASAFYYFMTKLVIFP